MKMPGSKLKLFSQKIKLYLIFIQYRELIINNSVELCKRILAQNKIKTKTQIQ